MKFTFGKLNSDGTKPAYLKRLDQKIFVCWFHPENDMQEGDTPTKAVHRMIMNAGYNGLEDYWNTNSKKAVK